MNTLVSYINTDTADTIPVYLQTSRICVELFPEAMTVFLVQGLLTCTRSLARVFEFWVVMRLCYR